MRPAAVLTVFRFEWRRTATLARLTFGAILAAFPIALVGLIQYYEGHLERGINAVLVLFILAPGITCLMTLLLWATPILPAELEGRTWPYLAVRPSGKGAVLVGKYLSAASWSALTACLSLTVCLIIVRPEQIIRTWCVLTGMSGLASMAFGALYTLMGVVVLRRGMALAVAYTLFDVLAAFIPAVVNKLSLWYHLLCVFRNWMSWDKLTEALHILVPTLPAENHKVGVHLLVLFGVTAVLLSVACGVLRCRQLVKADESQA